MMPVAASGAVPSLASPDDTRAIAHTRWLGAPAPGGLALPDAQATPAHLYAPRGVWFDDARCIIADSGNHRVLIWHGMPDADHAPADVVLGQADFVTEGPQAGGRGVRGGFHLPTGICVANGNLVLADAWHHRVLVWDGIPERSDTLPAYAIGQPSLDVGLPQRGADGAHALGLYWPYGVAFLDGWLWVCDTGNRRVLGWQGLPDAGRPPDLVLGQPDLLANDENRGGAVSASSFRWPHAVAQSGETLLVADAGNHRILGYTPVPRHDRPADLVLGQRDLASNRETPHVPQGPSALRFPYSVVADATRVIVADTANNRLLLWRDGAASGAGSPATAVIGQDNFSAAGENRWRAITTDSCCWPYGLWLHGNRLAIADSGNNRVLIHTLRSAWASDFATSAAELCRSHVSDAKLPSSFT